MLLSTVTRDGHLHHESYIDHNKGNVPASYGMLSLVLWQPCAPPLEGLDLSPWPYILQSLVMVI
jgi:hypothetical protein